LRLRGFGHVCHILCCCFLRPSTSGDEFAQLEVLDEETGAVRHESCRVNTVAMHFHLFNVPVDTFEHLRGLAVSTDAVLVTSVARRVTAALLIALPITVESRRAFSGPAASLPLLSLSQYESGIHTISCHDLVSLVKLVAAAEDVFVEGKATTGAGISAGPDGMKRIACGALLMGSLQVRSWGV
jgi:hypothetical protein